MAMPRTKDIRAAVEAELAGDPLVEAGGITVLNLSGDVSLNGTVSSYPQYLEAVEAAWRTPGVTSVRNHLQVVLPPENRRDDAMLTTEANNALAASSAGLDEVEAIAKNGDLTLTGLVKYGRHRAAAEVAVRGLTGVRNIKDEIELSFDVDPAEVNRLVRQALDRRQVRPEDRHVAANITGSTVVLVGRVQDYAQRDAVVAAAWLAHGIMVVIDEIEVVPGA
jgi:osmotically-inducible protein OsmY